MAHNLVDGDATTFWETFVVQTRRNAVMVVGKFTHKIVEMLGGNTFFDFRLNHIEHDMVQRTGSTDFLDFLGRI